ncbi:MAG: N,N'-diacetyllegionaminate synthase [Vicingaceae bacterium]|jgi:N,N'-diacetyllegionaminate synthase
MKDFYTIAEVAQAHDGSLGILHSFIDAVSKTGTKAIKFQTHIAEAESSSFEPFRVNFSFEDKTRYDYWNRMEFTKEQWIQIGSHCKEVGLDFISSPFSLLAVDMLEVANVKIYKIGSGEVSNLPLIEKVCKTGKPIIISSGLSDLNELKTTIDLINSHGNKVSVLQCTTAYPTSPEQWCLNQIKELKKTFNIPVGFSDHSGDIFACLSAANWGATIFEYHVTFDKNMFGPDRLASLNMKQVLELNKGLDQIELALNTPLNERITEDVKKLKNIFGKSLAINKDLKKDTLITFEDLETKKPAEMGIPAHEYKKVVGKHLINNLRRWDFIQWNDLKD